MHFATTLAGLAGLASTAVAHGVVTNFATDGKWHKNFQPSDLDAEDPPETAGWSATNRDLAFVSTGDYQDPDVICHRDATPAKTSASVSAGGTVAWQWNQWVDSHLGPIMTYVAKCSGDCADAKKEELKWVKIEEVGYLPEQDTWAANILAHDSNVTWTTTVPKELAAGNYVFRHEILAVYGKQHYPQCVNIEVTGDGTENPEGVIGTELYHEGMPEGNPGDPGAEPLKYKVPGPALWVPGSNSGSADNSTTPSQSATASATSGAVSSSAADSEATSAASSSAATTEATSAASSSAAATGATSAASSSAAVTEATSAAPSSSAPVSSPAVSSPAETTPVPSPTSAEVTSSAASTDAADPEATVPSDTSDSTAPTDSCRAGAPKKARRHARELKM